MLQYGEYTLKGLQLKLITNFLFSLPTPPPLTVKLSHNGHVTLVCPPPAQSSIVYEHDSLKMGRIKISFKIKKCGKFGLLHLE